MGKRKSKRPFELIRRRASRTNCTTFSNSLRRIANRLRRRIPIQHASDTNRLDEQGKRMQCTCNETRKQTRRETTFTDNRKRAKQTTSRARVLRRFRVPRRRRRLTTQRSRCADRELARAILVSNRRQSPAATNTTSTRRAQSRRHVAQAQQVQLKVWATEASRPQPQQWRLASRTGLSRRATVLGQLPERAATSKRSRRKGQIGNKLRATQMQR